MAGSTSSNLTVVPVVVDVAGWYSDASGKGGQRGLFVPVSLSRVLGAIPAFGATSAIVNVTSTETTIPGFMTVSPTGQPRSTSPAGHGLS